jgi:hypothetical protein
LKLLYRKRLDYFTQAEELAHRTLDVSGTQKFVLLLLKESALRELEGLEYVVELEKEVKRLKEKYEGVSW